MWCWNAVTRCSTWHAFLSTSKQSESLLFKNNTWQNVSNEICSRLMFKLSPSCNYTNSKSLSPLSKSFVDDAQVPLIAFVQNALRSSWTSLISVLHTRSCIAWPRSCGPPGSPLDWWVATSLVGLWDEFWCHSFQQFDSIASPMNSLCKQWCCSDVIFFS